MINLKDALFIKYINDGSYVDITNSMADYGRDFETVELEGGPESFFIGYTKPIDRVYVEFNTPNTVPNKFTFFYWNGSQFVNYTDFLIDETNGFTRSGFISWEQPLDENGDSLEGELAVDGQNGYWYQLAPNAAHSAGTSIKGINLIFSDDQDMKKEIPEIISDSRYLPSGEGSHILLHESARDELIQWLRRQQYIKKGESDRDYSDINQWDLLNSPQLRKAATYLAIGKLYLDQLSDAVGDVYEVKGQRFMEKYKMARDLYLIEIDTDNDGVLDSDEVKVRPQAVILGR